ncbi:MAG: hypothetical protein J6I34_07350, partial [Prevotella sp.]|nr:hypothetical protein [Prevotella sp.]
MYALFAICCPQATIILVTNSPITTLQPPFNILIFQHFNAPTPQSQKNYNREEQRKAKNGIFVDVNKNSPA